MLIVSIRKQDGHFMQIIYNGNKLHEMATPGFWGK